MREAIRLHREELITDVDVILHPRRTVLQAEFPRIERDVLRAFRAIQTDLAQVLQVKSGDADFTHGQ
jgi:ribonuclease P protein component